MAKGQTYEKYLMEMLGYPTLLELRKFLNEPERPTGGMRPPDGFYQDIQSLVEEERKLLTENEQPVSP